MTKKSAKQSPPDSKGQHKMTAIWIIIIIKLIAILLSLAMYIAKKLSARKPVSIQQKHESPQLIADTFLADSFPPIQLEITAPKIPQQPIMKIKPTILQPTAADMHSLASQMAAEANLELDSTLWIYRQVMEAGGLKPYANEKELEEFQSNTPIHFRRKNGLPPDKIADMLGYESDTELYNAIQTEQRLRNSHPKKYLVKHFMQDAKETLFEELNPHLDRKSVV